MKIATALTRPFAKIRAWLYPETSAVVLNVVQMLKARPKDFEIATEPCRRGLVFIQPKAGPDPKFGRICLKPDLVWIERESLPTELLSVKDRYTLILAVQDWLRYYS